VAADARSVLLPLIHEGGCACRRDRECCGLAHSDALVRGLNGDRRGDSARARTARVERQAKHNSAGDEESQGEMKADAGQARSNLPEAKHSVPDHNITPGARMVVDSGIAMREYGKTLNDFATWRRDQPTNEELHGKRIK